LKVAQYTGWLAPQDATGHAVLAMHDALQARGAGSVIYCDRSNITRPEVRVMDGFRSHLREWPEWREADVHLFHFGASYDLFNLLPWIPRGARRMVYFHGLTPRELVPASDREWADHSRRKFRLADRADLVMHATGYSRDLARSMGVVRPDYAALPLPVDLPEVPRPVRRDDGIFRLLHVGRLVPNKGLLDILQALRMLGETGFNDWDLEVVHNPLSAHPAYESEVRRFLTDSKLDSQVRFTGPPASREDLARRYAAADLTVLATRHETYCLPLLESLRCGTPVVACSAGAVAESAAGLALLVPPADIEALAAAIMRIREAWPRIECDDMGIVPATEFLAACRSLLHDRSISAFGEGLWRILQGHH